MQDILEGFIWDNQNIPEKSLFSLGHSWDVAGKVCVSIYKVPETSLQNVFRIKRDVLKTYRVLNIKHP